LHPIRLDEDDDKEKEKAEDKTPEQPISPVAQALFKSRTVLIFGEVDMKLAERVTAQLLAHADSEGDIRVILNSPGGHVESGDTIHDVVRFLGSRVKIIGTGWVASAGTHIFIAAPKERRVCLPNTRFMIHQPGGGAGGPATDIAIQAKEIIKTRERIAKVIAKQTGQDLQKVLADMERDFWMSADEAIQYGLVSKVIETSRDLA
jgi:ATP-dependent Clp protease protease subunit